MQSLDLIVELDWTETFFRMLDLIVELIESTLDWIGEKNRTGFWNLPSYVKVYFVGDRTTVVELFRCLL